ncbi:MAG: cation:proton antiporter domain-containing protein [Candidatus Loosdrechtia sp.]|uniref:cation:proton antiporter n=1 Tax=Candidatus Loosdrechtia sp. TaxID=3101272 RepID=UPI003A6B71A3|nr:MAG: cation:proton antiporter [Candidatus Jettenia sp. AMX2]
MVHRIFILLIISFYCILIQWLPAGNAEDQIIPEDFQQIYIPDETEIEHFVDTRESSGEKSAKAQKEDYVQKESLDKKYRSITVGKEDISSEAKEKDKIPVTHPPSLYSAPEPVDTLHLRQQLYPPLLFPTVSDRDFRSQSGEATGKEYLVDDRQLPIEEKEIQTRIEDSKFLYTATETEEGEEPSSSFDEEKRSEELPEPEEIPEEVRVEEVPAAEAVSSEPVEPEKVPQEVRVEEDRKPPVSEVAPSEPGEPEEVPAEVRIEKIEEPPIAEVVPSEPGEPEEVPAEVRVEEIEEPPVTEVIPPEPSTEIIKERKEVRRSWDIWQEDPTHGVILAVIITLIAAKIGGWVANIVGLPAVVGKVIIGILLGNVYFITGYDFFNFLRETSFLKMLSYFGTLLLLLAAGLSTDLRLLLKVGTSSFLTCMGGIIAPVGLGLMLGHFLLPDASSGAKILLAIVLCNSCTGSLQAVLNELKVVDTRDGRIMMGASILTDVVVLLTFGVITGFVVSGGISLPVMFMRFGIAFIFVAVVLVAILRYGERFGNFLTRRLTEGLNLPIVVVLSLLLALMFGSIGLHTVIGAFAAGLFLRNVKLRDSDDREYRSVESFIRPFYKILVPILFVQVGAQVELKSLLNADAILFGLALTAVAVAGKMFSGLCPIEKKVNRLAIGMGMSIKLAGVLITAGIGRDIGVFDDVIFSSLIMVIVFTSIVCPSFLRALLLEKKDISPESLPCVAEKKEPEPEKVAVN